MQRWMLITIAAGMTVLTAVTITFAATTDAEINWSQTEGSETLDEAVQPVMTRQQMRIHAATGPPEGFEPIQRQLRLHQGDGQATAQCQNGDECQNTGHSRGSGQGFVRGQNGGAGAGRT